MSKFLEVAIVDYGMGNLFSVKHACENAGLCAEITFSKKDILSAGALILPGVGAFGDAMNNLKALNLVEPIMEFIKSGKPFIGICLGMQLLFSRSEEFGIHQGLGIIEGKVLRFPANDTKGNQYKVPQVGWNQVYRSRKRKEKGFENTPMAGIHDGEYMYFVHSFYCEPYDESIVLSFTKYGGIEYCSSIISGNIFACQFHPERSAQEGLKIYRHLINIIRNPKLTEAGKNV